MAGFSALSVRDLVALTRMIARTVADPAATKDAHTFVAEAFDVADAFVAQSEGHWADTARANHAQRREKK